MNYVIRVERHPSIHDPVPEADWSDRPFWPDGKPQPVWRYDKFAREGTTGLRWWVHVDRSPQHPLDYGPFASWLGAMWKADELKAYYKDSGHGISIDGPHE